MKRNYSLRATFTVRVIISLVWKTPILKTFTSQFVMSVWKQNICIRQITLNMMATKQWTIHQHTWLIIGNLLSFLLVMCGGLWQWSTQLKQLYHILLSVSIIDRHVFMEHYFLDLLIFNFDIILSVTTKISQFRLVKALNSLS